MRQRLSTVGIGFLVLVLLTMAMTLGSCSKSAEERDVESEVPEAGATATESLSDIVGTPLPGETVVSAVIPSSGTLVPQVQATQALSDTVQAVPTLSSAAPQPTATAVPAAIQATSQPVTQQGTVVHTVQQGETLSSIARRYGTTWQAIAQANGIANPNQIYAGQQLKIPTSGSTSGGSTSGGSTGCRLRHTVKQGEWVWQIARTYGADPYDILAANGLTVQTANTILPGTVLCIP